MMFWTQGMRDHWANCITHRNEDVVTFIQSYFAKPDKKVLLLAAAGFDPRANVIAKHLAGVLDERLSAIFVREERPNPTAQLAERADQNEVSLRELVPECEVIKIEIFADDGAPVGGHRISQELVKRPVPDDVTDVVLDLSALSIGIGFPSARMLLEACEARMDCAFHIMITSDPELDDQITSDPSDRPSPVKGFAPTMGPVDIDEDQEVAQIWIPQLAQGRMGTLIKIGNLLGDFYKVCPLLPFPARNPRRADNLVTEYQTAIIDEWSVDARDFVHASEWNPLDCYRRLTRLKLRFDRTMSGTYIPRMVLSPIGSKVLAAGALMAAIDHDMSVQYVETESYSIDDTAQRLAANDAGEGETDQEFVHVILSGPLYKNFRPTQGPGPATEVVS